MVCVRERKLGEDGQLRGYLLERDGLMFVVSMRDLYDESIVSELISAGYKYHDYYGDIENEAGIPINELSSSLLTPEDNTSFMSCFEESALTEQQMLQYMSLNMKKVQTVEFLEPIEIRIKTREELLAYLKQFKYIRQKTHVRGYLLPLNAICAPEALFSVEELEQSSELLEYFDLISQRRTFITRSTIKFTIDKFIELGLMEEEERDNPDIFIKAWCAWGPEGIRTKCIESRWLQDVIFPCDIVYSSTGAEELTFDSKASTIRHKVTPTTLDGVKYTIGYALMDKSGNVYYSGTKLTPNDIISNVGNILITDDNQQQYNKYRRDAAKWTTNYRIIEVVEISHINRMSFTLQVETGQLYQYRMDRELFALVGTHSRIYSNVFGRIKLENGSFITFDRGFNKDVIIEQIVFRTLVKEMINALIMDPPFMSTVELCSNNGMNYEQIIDYIEYLRGNKEASPVLHDALPAYFYNIFGEGLDQLEDDATLLDKLEVLLENLDNKTDPNSPECMNLDAIVSDISKLNTDEWNAALFVLEDNPVAKFNAILSFNKDTCAGEQYEGRVADSKEGFIGPLITLVKSAYMINNKEYSPVNLLPELQKIKNGEYFDLKDKMSSLHAEYNGALIDHGSLNMLQMTTAEYSTWIMGIITEIAGKPLNERRHLAFYGWKMNIVKGTGIRKIINRIIQDLDMQVKKDQTYFLDKDRFECTRSFCTYILRLIWAIRSGNALFKQDSAGNLHYEVSRIDSLGTQHSADIVFYNREYNYIVNPACPDFSVFVSTLHDWCRYSMFMDSGSLNFYAVCENARINPWYVEVKEGYPAIPVYNGAINLITTDTWNQVYATQMPDFYKAVMQVSGRAPICVADPGVPYLFASRNNDFVDLALFTEENKRLGINGNRLPSTMADYFLDDNRSETLTNYYARAIHTVKAAPAGKRLMYMPLKSDIYYQNIAAFYDENVVSQPVYGDNLIKPTEAINPIMLGHDKSKKELDVNQVRIYKFNEYKFNSEDLAVCTALITGSYENKADCYVGVNVIVTPEKKRLSTVNITKSDIDMLVQQGCAYNINANTFIIYAVNGAFVCEV